MSALPRALHGRPRGFIENWHPRPETLVLLDQVRAILAEYVKHLPLTLRQIFYRLVGAYEYEKTEKAYDRLGETMNKARRARVISFDAIRDDGFHRTGFVGWGSAEEAHARLVNVARKFRLDRQLSQPRRVVLWCEASGMVPQLESVAAPYSVPVYSSGGFDSVTVKYEVAREFAERGEVLVLHIGDHDPSGVHLFGSLDEDVRAFLDALGGAAEFHRLAVIPEHIEAYNLPTAPPTIATSTARRCRLRLCLRTRWHRWSRPR